MGIRWVALSLCCVLGVGAGVSNPWRLTSDEQVTFYVLTGTTAQELRKEIRAKGPLDASGIRRDAHVSWRILWNWKCDSAGLPIRESVKVHYQIQTVLPRWQPGGPIDSVVQREWELYYAATLLHEEGHKRHVRAHWQEVEQALAAVFRKEPRPTARQLNQAANIAAARIRALDEEYDTTTRHGRLQGVRLGSDEVAL